MLSSKVFGAALGAALVIGFGSPAWATVSYSDPTVYFGSVGSPIAAGSTVNESVAGFDTSLGTLTGVVITTTVNLTADITVGNFSTSPLDFTNATASVPVTVNGPLSWSFTTTPVATVSSGTTTANPGETSYPGITSVAGNAGNVPAGDLSSWLGVSNLISLTVGSGAGTYSGTGGNALFGGNSTFYGDFIVTYEYDPANTPEPTSVLLFGAALVGFGVARGKQRNPG